MTAAMEPQPSEATAIATSSSPCFTTSCSPAASCPAAEKAFIAFTRSAVKNGISTSKNTSPVINISVRIVGFLYSRRLCASFFITFAFASFL